jgi:hypothetical protein
MLPKEIEESKFRGLGELFCRIAALSASARRDRERDAKLKSIREKTAKVKKQIKILEAL